MNTEEALDVIEGILQRYCDLLYEAEDVDTDEVWKAYKTMNVFLRHDSYVPLYNQIFVKEPIVFDTGKALKRLKKCLTNYSRWSWEPEEFDEDEMWKAFKIIEEESSINMLCKEDCKEAGIDQELDEDWNYCPFCGC